MSARTYLFVPGHDERRLAGAFQRGADIVIVDLEDAVPESDKVEARRRTRSALLEQPGWVRINKARTDAAAADLDAIADVACGIRIPKTETTEEVLWVAQRAPGRPLLCAIETARGVLAAAEIATIPGVVRLAIGGLDLQRDLGVGPDPMALLHARSHVVLASIAAGIDGPVDSVYPDLRDDRGLRAEAEHARSLGFTGKSAIHPAQLATIRAVFSASADELAWASAVIAAFAASEGNPTTLANGSFVDLPVVRRAESILSAADPDVQLGP